MGRDERNRQVVMSEARDMIALHRENLLGPVLEYDAHKGSCPKCEFHELLASWCPGRIHTLPIDVSQPCKAEGEHLHRACARCGYEWRERCKPEALLSE